MYDTEVLEAEIHFSFFHDWIWNELGLRENSVSVKETLI